MRTHLRASGLIGCFYPPKLSFEKNVATNHGQTWLLVLRVSSLLSVKCPGTSELQELTSFCECVCMCLCVCGENEKLFSPKPKYLLQVVISHYKFIQADYCCAFSVYGMASQKAIEIFRSSVKACRHIYYIGPWPLDVQCHWQNHFLI